MTASPPGQWNLSEPTETTSAPEINGPPMNVAPLSSNLTQRRKEATHPLQATPLSRWSIRTHQAKKQSGSNNSARYSDRQPSFSSLQAENLTRDQAIQQVTAKAPQCEAPTPATTRPGRSFRDALKGNCNAETTSEDTQTSGAQTPQEDPRDRVMETLAAALRALVDTAVCDPKARELCVAALDGHEDIAHHG
ncbi:hypothetical protein HPB51_017424 [Rhipicephalus microplus]|uniref:Uncharacterized protein n=1 Tax=Rhipicephalus microplus TaxID=6941 RepID=A0A9J6D6I3_RHIMP|nr:hypothetical protein HPB51_017424 [Rhipicephalus microplus]